MKERCDNNIHTSTKSLYLEKLLAIYTKKHL